MNCNHFSSVAFFKQYKMQSKKTHILQKINRLYISVELILPLDMIMASPHTVKLQICQQVVLRSKGFALLQCHSCRNLAVCQTRANSAVGSCFTVVVFTQGTRTQTAYTEYSE